MIDITYPSVETYGINGNKKTTSLEEDRPYKEFRFRGRIPTDFSLGLLQGEPVLQQPLPPLIITTLDRFVLESLSGGISTDSAEIAEEFVTSRQAELLKQQLRYVEDLTNTLDIDTDSIIETVRSDLINTLYGLGARPGIIYPLTHIPMQIRDSHGPSFAKPDELCISKFQVVRKALDFKTVFDSPFSLEKISQIKLKSIVAHEFGHAIDRMLSTPSYIIEGEELSPDFEDVKYERFAEFWGRYIFGEDQDAQKLLHQEWLIHVASAAHFWQSLRYIDETYPHNEFSMIRFIETLNEIVVDPQVKDYIECKQGKYTGSYLGAESEFYAMPYSKEIVFKAMQTQMGRMAY